MSFLHPLLRLLSACFISFLEKLFDFYLSLKTLSIYGVAVALGATAVGSNSWKKQDYHEKLKASLIKQFDSLKIVGDPKKESPHRLASTTKSFKDAPLRITIFQTSSALLVNSLLSL